MVKKITIKKNKKPTKAQKQKQTQKQSVTVNIGSSITKKRARTSQQKKPTQQPIIYPSSTISLNQPTIKYPNPTQNPLISAIIPQPKIEETKVNDLEKVRTARVEKLEVKPSEPYETLFHKLPPKASLSDEPIFALREIRKDSDKISHALLGQIYTDKQDDTEELSQLFQQPTRPPIEFISSSTQTFSPNISSGPLSNLPPIISKKELLLLRPKQEQDLFGLLKEAETFEYNAPSNKALLDSLQDKYDAQQQLLFERLQAEESLTQAEEPFVDPEVVAQQQEVLQQIQERGPAELIAERPTPLKQESVELGFGGLAEEPISQGALEVKEAKKPPKTILAPIPQPPSILKPSETSKGLLEELVSSRQAAQAEEPPDKFTAMKKKDIINYLNSNGDYTYSILTKNKAGEDLKTPKFNKSITENDLRDYARKYESSQKALQSFDEPGTEI
jgi:hypothetical protein